VNIWTPMSERLTPFFKPHSIEILGTINVAQDDNRFYNNVFLGGPGTASYDVHGLAITSVGNVFACGSAPSKRDHNSAVVEEYDPGAKLTREADGWWLEVEVNPAWKTAVPRSLVVSELLGRAIRPDAPFEQPDGSPYRLHQDYFGAHNSDEINPEPGPFAGSEESILIEVWPKG
jgi:hypothetical protein